MNKINIFTIVGIALMGASAIMLYNSLIIARYYQRTDGTVIDQTRHVPGNRPLQPIFYPTVSFMAKDGKTYVFEQHYAAPTSPFKLQEKIPVWYDPDNPNHAQIGYFLDIWGVPLIISAFGTIFFTLGFFSR